MTMRTCDKNCIANVDGKCAVPDLKPCYGKCKSCVWKYNGGCSEWNGWGHRVEEVGNDDGKGKAVN